MAVLIEKKVEQNVADTRHELLEWHSRSGRLAVSSYNANFGSEVNFFTQQGGKSEHAPTRKANARITQLKWHPEDDILAVAWDNGDVVLRYVEDSNEFLLPVDDDPLDAIKCLVWNSTGSLICVADKKGAVTLNKVDRKKLRQSRRLQKVNIGEPANCALCKKSESAVVSSKKGEESLEAAPNIAGEVEVDAVDTFTNAIKATKEGNPTVKPADVKLSCFIIGGDNGGLYTYIEADEPHKVFQAESAIVQVLEVESKSLVLALGREMMLYQLVLLPNAKVEEKIRVKLSGKWPNFHMIMAEEGILAMCSAEKDVRIWNLNTEDNGTISLRTSKGFSPGDVVVCISYSPRKGCLSGGTSDGKVATWKRRVGGDEESIEEGWKLQEAVDVGSQVTALCWAITSNALAVSTGFAVTILKEQPILSHMSSDLAAIQTGNMSFLLVRLHPTEQQELQLTLSVKGIFVGEKHIAVWDHEQIAIYEMVDSVHSPLKSQIVSCFACAVSGVAVYQQNVYCLEPEKVNVRTIQGTVKQILAMPEMEGDPMLMDLRSSWLCVATSNGFLRIYDLSRREAKQQYHSKYVVESIDNFSRFSMVRLNKDGNRVSFTCTIGNAKEVYSCLTIWDAESDTIYYFDFSTGMTDQQQYEAETDAALAAGQRPTTAAVRKIEKEQSRYRMLEHTPGVHCWDSEDPRFLICEANYRNPDIGPNYLLSMFVTSEHGLQMQDLQPRSVRSEALFGVAVPFLYFIKKTDNDDEDTEYEKSLGRLLLKRVLREFVGLENSDKSTKEAMLNFSLYLTVGRMDEAFKAIKFIKSESVWEHMAQMCVKTRRLDVALVCLGNMGHARGARALRKAMKSGAPQEVQVAILAIQLGLIEEARSLFASCGRYDLVNRLLQSHNQWNSAFEVAEHNDRIHLRNTYYAYAKYLESLGANEGAIENYEKSDTQRFEVPRMLFDDPKVLETYVKKRRDPNLQRWWAQYLESIGDLDGARGFYYASKDYLSVVRLFCYNGCIKEATEVANTTADKAACYHLGRYFENEGDMNSAVHFFTKAHAYSSAIRLARDHGMKDKLANLALMAGGSDLVEAARYYEDIPGQADKAVMLYHKAGMIGRALDLAFRTEQFSALDLIAKDLDERSDPRVLERAAEFFISNQQYEKAVRFLGYAKNFTAAIELCRKKNVPITEQMAEILTPPKEAVPNAAERTALLEQIADCCVQQRNYHFAAKKYTQAGNTLQAMRSLLKSGDTDKIIFFAKKARNKEIYILAGNFLQTLNWKADADLMRHIENFYTKANAYERLASFYEACAQVEIDDYRDYNKANAALVEAQRCITKALQNEPRNATELNEKLEELNSKSVSIKKFIGIQAVYETDASDAIRQLQLLADEKGIDDSVRIGDIYAVMITHNVRKSNYKKAYSLIEQMQKRQPRIDVSRYVNTQILDTICDELKMPRLTNATAASDEEEQAEGGVEYSHALKRQIEKESSFADSSLQKALNS